MIGGFHYWGNCELGLRSRTSAKGSKLEKKIAQLRLPDYRADHPRIKSPIAESRINCLISAFNRCEQSASERSVVSVSHNSFSIAFQLPRKAESVAVTIYPMTETAMLNPLNPETENLFFHSPGLSIFSQETYNSHV